MENQKTSLLERARKERVKKAVPAKMTDEHIELALAWAKGEINYTQVRKVLGIPPASTYSFLALALRAHLERNNLV